MRAKTRKDLSEKDRRFLWHPFTQMAEWEKEEPLVIDRAEGPYLYSIDGRRYIDGVSSIWVTLHGHRRREIDRAIRCQLSKVAHTTLFGLTHPTAIELAEKLVSIAPSGLSRVFYSDNGSTAMEVALKMAFHYWRHKDRPEKSRFVAFSNAYHGDTIGAVSLGGIPLFHGIYAPLLFPVDRLPAPYCYRCPWDLVYPSCRLACASSMEESIERNADQIAAVVVEPLVFAAGGMLTMPPGYLKRLREATSRHGLLLIADEVATGFGRTGTMFACEQEGVTPDLMAVAKGLTGGYLPLGATLATEEIYEAFKGEYSEFKTFFHGHSYTGNPLGCAAALASLKIFEKEGTLQKVRAKGEYLERLLEPLKRHPHVGEIRRSGLIAAIELVENRDSKQPYPLGLRMGHRVAMEARRRGAILRPLGNVIVLMPPLGTPKPVLKRLAIITVEAISTVTRG